MHHHQGKKVLVRNTHTASKGLWPQYRSAFCDDESDSGDDGIDHLDGVSTSSDDQSNESQDEQTQRRLDRALLSQQAMETVTKVRNGIHGTPRGTVETAYLNLANDALGNLHCRTCRHRELMIDSRDRDVTVYPSANQFDAFLGDRMKGLKSMELLTAIIPIPAGFTDRYVVLALDNCEEAMMFADRVPFGMATTAPAVVHRTGCSFPPGSMAMIPLVGPTVVGTTVTWTNDNVGQGGYKVKFKGDMTNKDRLVFSLWCWDYSTIPVRYPLPNDALPPIVPNIANNVTFVFRMHYH